MATKPQEHHPTLPSINPHRHSSDNAGRSSNDAGGIVDKRQYEKPTPEEERQNK